MRTGRLLAPEVVQTSTMDCGPACLKSLLEGHGISVSYDRLREVCQTDLDGTSIDTIEQVARELGLDAEQIVVPVDHLSLPEANALPALVVVRLPNAMTHFVIAWAHYGGRVQVMDPAQGRHWPDIRNFLENVYVHSHPVAATQWRQWAGSDEFVQPLRRRIRALHISEPRAGRLVDAAIAQQHWRPLAALDAAVRMMEPMIRSGGLSGDETAGATLEQFVELATAGSENPFHVIPHSYWSVLPARGYTEDDPKLILRGAVLLRVRGKLRAAETSIPLPSQSKESATTEKPLQETLRQTAAGTAQQVVESLRADGLLRPAAMIGALLLSSMAVLFEALLLRNFLDLGTTLGLPQQRLAAAGMLVGFLLLLLVLDVSVGSGLLRFGRRLEVRLRARLLHALPRLPDRYFASRLISDMAERAHAIHEIRFLPRLGGQLIRGAAELILTTAGLIWLDPHIAPLAIASMLSGTILPFVAQPLLAERDLKLRTHSGALCRFYFDALRGLVPIAAHCAGKSVRREHEALLVTWTRAGLCLQRGGIMLQAASTLISFGLTVCLLLSHITRTTDSAVGLLLVYWALNVPALGRDLAQVAWTYPRLHNLTRRLLEPLAIAEKTEEEIEPAGRHKERARSSVESKPSEAGVSIEFKDVTVRATGHTVLEKVDLAIESGSHVCIVGSSGAGKSSLVGLLLGWHRPSTGSVQVDGSLLDEAALDALRKETAWVDPGIQLWNRSLVDNLRYGLETELQAPSVGKAIEQADLRVLLASLPEGMQTRLGEGGALVSGGEGQRVRLGRAILRTSSRLVILDEPFSALDRNTRRSLLLRTRDLWKGSTLICITHDVSDSTHFERVIVMDKGKIVEDGSPMSLVSRKESRYRQLLEAEQGVRKSVWASRLWRNIRIEGGQISETSDSGDHERKHSERLLAG